MTNIVNGDSPEAVAYALFRDCLEGAGKSPNLRVEKIAEADLLALYGRCLAAVRGQRADRVDEPI